jgi:glycosyltransferase involved in cell wall biosynthesis
MKKYPKILKVETGWVEQSHKYFPTDEFVDYRVYDKVPKFWRRIEQFLRMDIYLAFRAKKIANQYDVIWANSEKVAVPLSFLRIKKPLVVILQFPESPLRFQLLKLSGIARKWAGIGIVAKDARYFLQSKLGIDPEKIFQYFAARTDIFKPVPSNGQKIEGPILSMGVAKRDYSTLIEALADLPGYRTEIFISSKYGDSYKGSGVNKIPDWICFPEPISDVELVARYQHARFVVIPLKITSHSGAGVTSAFEAWACGRPVIATNTGGMDSYVINGKTGILVPPGDVKAMRYAIRKLWENPVLAQEMGLAGRKFLEENYKYEMVVGEITDFLTRLWEKEIETRK